MKVRVISSIVALMIVVPLILLGGIYFELGVCVIATLAFKEIIDLKKSHDEIPNLMIFLSLICLIFLTLSNSIGTMLYKGFSYPLLTLMVICLILPIIFYKDNKYTSKNAFYLLGIVFFLGLIFNIFIKIRMRDIYTFIFLLIIPMINDIFAYLIGRKFGKNKMCKTISPNKTWEGSIGGLVFGTVLGLVYYHFLIGNIDIKIVLMIIVLSAMGQMGDLVMSKIKRENDIKDFSNIMPGHGGILDRIDSSIFVFLAYIFLMAL